ncbi:Homoserine/homoserine lactone efflux protein [Piscirickettsia salmonis]|uniref:Homoserine lactone transporter n=1 Tax=Piscirickettsia salmonis TaxID=1238 RepID=A0A1L6TEA9_PISSA|nr:LysE family translocator [Piscirickettsia salmonis]AKP72709.1 homoserine lactone transporter [Piscirickettsia salmonis LF-89 = ATCC VR-1361]ALB23790.1 homoserine lactone transporter [Piscirickettsia salmonis]ALY03637.1 homoserine lactone transporter [Piscirickettsia salmonis]AMA43199.1 homoserine lactone transporter [Piscirickettsia salmonis]AOS35670.1 homoserine lactone transporter [Piscirickettsia salmonis]
MSIADIITFTNLAFFLAIIPGPNALLVLQTSLTQGKRPAYANILGIVLAFYIHASISAFGLSYLFSTSNVTFNLLKWLGAAYLIWLGTTNLYNALKSKIKATPALLNQKTTTNLPNNFIKGFLTNLLNPKVILFYLAIFPQFIHHGNLLEDSLVLGSLQATIVGSWFILVVTLAERFKGIFNSSRNTSWLKGMSGSLFISFGIKLALLSR